MREKKIVEVSIKRKISRVSKNSKLKANDSNKTRFVNMELRPTNIGSPQQSKWIKVE